MSTTAIPLALPKRASLSLGVLIRHAANLLPLVLVHVGAFAILWTGSHWYDWVAFAAFMYQRGMCQAVGYHRYFSHRSFKTSRVFQFVMGFFCCTNLQQGPLWWAVYHRHHHKHFRQQPGLGNGKLGQGRAVGHLPDADRQPCRH